MTTLFGSSFIYNYIRIVTLCFCLITKSVVSKDSTIKHTEVTHKLLKTSQEAGNLQAYEKRQQIASEYLNSLPKSIGMWVDPHEMIHFEVDLAQSDPTPQTDASVIENEVKPCPKDDLIRVKVDKTTNTDKVCILDRVYLTRWLKKLLIKIENKSNREAGVFTIPFDSMSLERLEKLSTANSDIISAVDDFIGHLLAQSSFTKMEKFNVSMSDSFYVSLIWNTIYILCFVTVLFVLYDFYKHRPIVTIITIAILVNVFWHWMHLYEKRKAIHHTQLEMTAPEECRKQQFTLFGQINEYIKSYFVTNDCSKYYEALLVDPFWEVSFTVALSEAITATVFQPLSASSKAINIAIKQLFDGLSLGMSVFIITFLFLVLIMVFKYKLRLPYFLAVLEPTCNTGSQVENIPMKKLRNVVSTAIKSQIQSLLQPTYTKVTSTPVKSDIQDNNIVSLKTNHSNGSLEKDTKSELSPRPSTSNCQTFTRSFSFDNDCTLNEKKVNIKKTMNSTSDSGVSNNPKYILSDENECIIDENLEGLKVIELDTTQDSGISNGLNHNGSTTHLLPIDCDSLVQRKDLTKISPKAFDPFLDCDKRNESYSDCSCDILKQMHVNCKICSSKELKTEGILR